jgi:magnesium chelatase subunit D
MRNEIASDLADATWVAGILAVAGSELGGAHIAQDTVDDFAAAYEKASGAGLRSMPASVSSDTLLGAIDLAATLATGRPVHTLGLLQQHPRLVLRRAERLDAACAAIMARSLDDGELVLIAAIDAADADAALSPKLEARLSFFVSDAAQALWTSSQINDAQQALPTVVLPEVMITQLCAAALAIGIASPRAVLQTVTTARVVAALKGLTEVDEASAALAARLVLAPRALYAPEQPNAQDENEPDVPPPPPSDDQSSDENSNAKPADAEVILEAITMALPPDLLQMAGDAAGKRGAGRQVKNAAQRKAAGQRGRRVGHRRASSLAGQRLDILATLRNAAPWQPLRRKAGMTDRMVVTRDDFRVARIKQRNEATAIFAVDASGSTAFQRLAEAKGAVETILAECYVRRDKVALVSFRAKKAEVLLPPTRSLERAKRALASLPGGGGTPLASGLDEAFALALQVRRAGSNPIVIFLTDGRGNVARDGEGNKVKALEETQSAARFFAAEGFDAMVIDVSPVPHKSARELANAMQATYMPMPRAGAADIARPVRNALKAASA